VPHYIDLLPHQAEFLANDDQMLAVRGGIRSGKSYVIAHWMHDRMEQYPDGQHFAIGADLPQLKRGFLRTFTALLEQLEVPYDYLSTSGTVVLQRTGAKLESLSAEISERIRSTEIDSVLLEEPQTWQDGLTVYRVIVGRMSGSAAGKKYRKVGMQPRLRMSFNPDAAGSWLWELLEREHAMKCFQFSVRDNYLMPMYEEYIKLQESQLPPSLWSVELDGNWGTSGGQVYRYYSAANHAVPPEGLPPLVFDPTKPLDWTLDFNIGCQASLICQQHEQKRRFVRYDDANAKFGMQVRTSLTECEVKGVQEAYLYFLAELRITDCSVYQLVPIFLDRYGDWARRAPVVRLFGDSTGGSRNQATLETNWEVIRTLLSNAGIRVEFCVKTNPLEGDRVNAVNAQFWTGDGVGMWFDHLRCKYTISDFQTVTYKEGQNVIDKARDNMITHLSDAVGYRVYWLRREMSGPAPSSVKQRFQGFMQT
jgi:hypothetical protein